MFLGDDHRIVNTDFEQDFILGFDNSKFGREFQRPLLYIMRVK